MPDPTWTIETSGTVKGALTIPGDKSISHRALMLGAIAEGTTEIHGFLYGMDCIATMNVMRALGVSIEHPQADVVLVHGVGKQGLQVADSLLDCGNSGTSIRLLSGLLAGQHFQSVLTGDESLQRRPMGRVLDPLGLMGAVIHSHDNHAPLSIQPVTKLTGIEYSLPIASAQVKSCLLLAGLYAEGTTTVYEPAVTRDHTERMLQAFQYPIECQQDKISLQGGGQLTACRIDVPADLSSAAFFIVAAAITPGSDLTLTNIGINPTRTGILQLCQMMGADIEIFNERHYLAEPVADIRVKHRPLTGINVPTDLVSLSIDEFPILFIAAACASGKTVITGAEELRVKESDRITAMVDGLNAVGIDAQALPDGAVIQGGDIQGGHIDSQGDHRVAMAFAIASLRAKHAITIKDTKNVATSFPSFKELATTLGIRINE